MATLTNNQINQTYDSLLKLEDNDGLSGTKKVITDGLGNQTPLSISDTEVKSDVNVEASGFKTPTGTSSQILLADGSVGAIAAVADKHYEHNQTSASSLWNISHNLDKYPSVTVVDSGNTVVIGEVDHVTTNTLRINFLASFSGKAYLN